MLRDFSPSLSHFRREIEAPRLQSVPLPSPKVSRQESLSRSNTPPPLTDLPARALKKATRHAGKRWKRGDRALSPPGMECKDKSSLPSLPSGSFLASQPPLSLAILKQLNRRAMVYYETHFFAAHPARVWRASLCGMPRDLRKKAPQVG
ncbi:hypothetical protein EAG_09801 [Camponotus floridanus]|uniref:Uncharacterized protein n=1 Tax=Camponotus floridanus TaxID=104421 RepID=E2AUT0_CAMFO|nr:hypothetical protein EAG_09801 [Camponotus floridanus]